MHSQQSSGSSVFSTFRWKECLASSGGVVEQSVESSHWPEVLTSPYRRLSLSLFRHIGPNDQDCPTECTQEILVPLTMTFADKEWSGSCMPPFITGPWNQSCYCLKWEQKWTRQKVYQERKEMLFWSPLKTDRVVLETSFWDPQMIILSYTFKKYFLFEFNIKHFCLFIFNTLCIKNM